MDVLVEHWDPSRHLRDTRVDQGMPYLDRDDKLELLRLVARHMQDGPAGLAGNHIPGPDLIAEFDTYLRERYALPPDRSKPAAKAMLEQFRERNFILSRFGAGVYGFVHRAFLEYLAASDIVAQFNARELTEDQLITDVFGRRWPDPAWQEVLLLITGMIPERFAGQIIDHLLAADPLWFLRPREIPRHTLLAVRCLCEVRKLGMLSSQTLAITDAVISLLETAHERTEKYDSSLTEAVERAALPAFTALGPQGDGRRRYRDWYLLRGQFLGSSSNSTAQVESVAARIGAALLSNNHQFHQQLQAQATDSPRWALRRAAVQALAAGWHEDPGTLPLLWERATTDESGAVRQVVVQVLAAGWGDDPGTAALLRERARTDSDKDVRQASVHALVSGWRRDPCTFALVREQVTDEQEDMRRATLQILVVGWREHPDTASLLRERASKDEHGDVRRAAVQALAAGWRDDPETLPLLLGRARQDPEAKVREVVVQMLALGWGVDVRDRARDSAADGDESDS